MLDAAQRVLDQIKEKSNAVELSQHGIQKSIALGVACEGEQILVKSLRLSIQFSFCLRDRVVKKSLISLLLARIVDLLIL